MRGDRHCRPPSDRLGADDDGQVLLLLIAYSVIAIALVLVVVSASAVHLERKRLIALADSAALAAADEISVEGYYQRNGIDEQGLPLLDAQVRSAVQEFVDGRSVQSGFDEVAVGSGTGTADGRTAEVVLTAVATPPLVPWVIEGVAGPIELTATARARVVITP